MRGGGTVGPRLTYGDAGVDISAKSGLLAGLAPVIASTHGADVVAGVGAFAGAVRLRPAGAVLLAATTDGVGTKTLLAHRMGRDGVVGADIVAHCANDLVAIGARAIAFLDYIAMGRLVPSVAAAIVRAMAEACRALGIALLGGETAEMPDVYRDGAYDVAGTMIGTLPPDRLVDGAGIRPGNRVVGLASSGLHTNGYSLARRVLEECGISPEAYDDALGTSAGDALLAPHLCYAPGMLALLDSIPVAGIAHITGGGIVDNLARVLPEGCRARLRAGWPRPPVFAWLQGKGGIPEEEMVRAFNLGIGMAVVVPAGHADHTIEHFEALGTEAYQIGEIVQGVRGVEIS